AARDIAELSRLTIDELRRAAEDLSEAEIERARAQLKAGMLMGLESSMGQAERIARSLSIWGRVPDPAETAARIDAASRAEIMAYAENLVTSARPAMALYGPVARAPGLDELRDRLAA
ncbi:MAG: insulinase family protein, partial [Paracoccus sp. (in: a-proteobacteria)]|nr:insulinase family protein [Paracoccus sp. (in: a-proteobacteria)]